MPMFQIIDLHTMIMVGRAKTLRGAMNASDRRNAEYGAHRYAYRRAV